jgi:hypothetical protein
MYMEFKVTINLDNAAFEDDPLPEVRRILSDLEKKLDMAWDVVPGMSGKLKDMNGNTVGQYCVEE